MGAAAGVTAGKRSVIPSLAPGERRRSRSPPWASARWLVATIGLLALGACDGCAGSRKQPATPAPPPARALGPAQEGIASHYAAFFAGRKTASGETYRPNAMTAAHRTLPMGTRVRVTRIDRAGNRVAGPVDVVINDRGPYAKGRIIDLSDAAAKQLGLYGGIARVRVEVVERAPERRR